MACASPTTPAMVIAMCWSIRYTFLACLWATKEPIVALVSVVRTTPSLQTTPIVVVNSKRPSLVLLGFPTCRMSSYFHVRSRFPRNGKICDQSVSDSLKTFSATIERSDHRGKYLRSFIVTPTVLDALVND